jgi:predicted acylesterase/phospholipase RssA
LGTSAGAITAAFLAAEYSVSEMMDALNEKGPDGKSVFTSFMGIPPAFSEQDIQQSATLKLFEDIDVPGIPKFIETGLDKALARALMTNPKYVHLFSFIERGGWYSADNFVEWMKRKMNEGEINGKPRDFGDKTFRQFHEATGRDLSLVAADTTGGQLLVLNHTTAPDLPVVWGVRMSMSIPMVWPEVQWQSEWGTYRGRSMLNRLIVDGGLLSNFPIELFISHEPFVTEMMGDTVSENVLGLLIDEDAEVPPSPAQSFAIHVDLQELQLVKRIKRLMNTVLAAHDKMVMESFTDRVVRLPAKDYGTTEFDMPDPRRDALVNAGYKTTNDYFAAREGQAPAALSFSFGTAGESRAEEYADKMAAKILGR